MDFQELLKPFQEYEAQKHKGRNPERLNELLALCEGAAELKKEVGKRIDQSVKAMGKEIRLLRKREDKVLEDIGILSKNRAA